MKRQTISMDDEDAALLEELQGVLKIVSASQVVRLAIQAYHEKVESSPEYKGKFRAYRTSKKAKKTAAGD
jgi:Ribbon-helix-helix protein, copG family